MQGRPAEADWQTERSTYRSVGRKMERKEVLKNQFT